LKHAPRLDHVAIAVPRVEDALDWLVSKLGGKPFSAGPGLGFKFWQFSFARDGRIEVLAPAGPADGFLHRFLASRGAGIHHLTFKVPDLDAAAARAQRCGYDVVGRSELDPAWKEAFLHPKQAQGIVVQLAESHPELEPKEWQNAFPFPPLPEAATQTADVLGVRLRAASEARARRQWQELLGAECSAEASGLVFRWPESALAVRVELDAGAAEGPLGIEIDAPGLRGPDDLVLGTRWLKAPAAAVRATNAS
jgi:methylmalonyl-CoA/ethylmalonyl-CoA epimerase